MRLGVGGGHVERALGARVVEQADRGLTLAVELLLGRRLVPEALLGVESGGEREAIDEPPASESMRQREVRGLERDLRILFAAGVVVLLAGLVVFGRDARMPTYAALVLVQGSLAWWLRGRR